MVRWSGRIWQLDQHAALLLWRAGMAIRLGCPVIGRKEAQELSRWLYQIADVLADAPGGAA